MHVTKWGEYGILCSVFLAKRYKATSISQSGEQEELGHAIPVGALEIAEEQKIPAQYTQQILQRLRRGNIVKSVRGAHGGYVLSRPPEAITLLDIMQAAEGSTFDVMCETSPAYPASEIAGSAQLHECTGHDGHGGAGCNLKGVWLEVRSAVDAVLTRRTLASLLPDPLTAENISSTPLIQISRAGAPTSSEVDGSP